MYSKETNAESPFHETENAQPNDERMRMTEFENVDIKEEFWEFQIIINSNQFSLLDYIL